MKHALETSRIFPHIAWILVTGFAIFTWTLTLHLKTEMKSMSANVDNIESTLSQMNKDSKRTEIKSQR